jgi:hypothetical protein
MQSSAPSCCCWCDDDDYDDHHNNLIIISLLPAMHQLAFVTSGGTVAVIVTIFLVILMATWHDAQCISSWWLELLHGVTTANKAFPGDLPPGILFSQNIFSVTRITTMRKLASRSSLFGKHRPFYTTTALSKREVVSHYSPFWKHDPILLRSQYQSGKLSRATPSSENIAFLY